MTPVEEITAVSRDAFDRELRPLYRPLVMRGAVAEWPLVHAAERSSDEALKTVERQDNGAPVEIMVAPPEAKGRFFYGSDLRGFNFQRQQGTLSQLAGQLRVMRDAPEPPGMYAGATALATHLPGLMEAVPFPLLDATAAAAARLWLGNATQIATHFDLSDNFAVVALGKRRFTLFPPEAVSDLYVGPLDVTLAGQPVSMVDPLAPDIARYPRFERALEQAQTAELEPGDAIYIPTLWWHHVAATEPINMLINFWHNDARQGGGFLALVHAILAIRDRPEPERAAWRVWFDHLVLGPNAPDSAAHLPPHASGVLGPPSPERDAMMRRYIAKIIATP